MWAVDENEITMCEGDYGIDLPITLNVELADNENLQITVKDAMNGNTLLTKSFKDALNLTAAETANLPVGKYIYSLDWYRNSVFLCNIIPAAKFKVVDKA